MKLSTLIYIAVIVILAISAIIFLPDYLGNQLKNYQTPQTQQDSILRSIK